MKIAVAGDFYPVAKSKDNKFTHIFDESLAEQMRAFTRDADFAIVNYESPVYEAGIGSPLVKCGPGIHSSASDVAIVRRAGFDAVTLANNHTLDYDGDALMHTIDLCKQRRLDVVGAGGNLDEASKTLYKEIGDKTLAIINCCEHEFSIAQANHPGTNPLNPVAQFQAIKQARKQADYVMVIVHGGHEYCQLPSPRMKETYRFFIDAGADAVVNHHQHCFSGYEVYNSCPIFYGLGNFVFPWEGFSSTWGEGYVVHIDFADTITFSLLPYKQNAADGIRPMTADERKVFDADIARLNDIIADDTLLSQEHAKWMRDHSGYFMTALAPYSNRYLKALCTRGLLPSFLSKSRIAWILNLVECEAHRDRLIRLLRDRLYPHK